MAEADREQALSALRTLEAHRSVREYRPDPVPPADLRHMMTVAARASTGGSGQLYSIVRVADRSLREQIATSVGQEHIAAAAEFFVTCLDTNRLRQLLHARGEVVEQPALTLYATTDALLATANLATAAELLGYGICYIGAIQRVLENLIEILGLPAGVCPLVGMCIGVPASRPKLSPRLPIEVLFHENQYRELTANEVQRCFDAMATVTYDGGWPNVLRNSFTPGGEYEAREQHWRSALLRQGFRQ